jgi:hypothetical protein
MDENSISRLLEMFGSSSSCSLANSKARMIEFMTSSMASGSLRFGWFTINFEKQKCLKIYKEV